jgi:hypothetical protein
MPDMVEPRFEAGRYVLDWGAGRIEIDPITGGRVTALHLDGGNLLTGPDVDPGNYGSTFWPAPQSAWGWPPLAEVDHGPYEVIRARDALVLNGASNPALNVSIDKRVAADRARGAVVFEFSINNRASAPMQLAPWQITRVPPGGLSFFPTGSGSYPPSNLAVREQGGVTWYAYDAAAITDHQKLFADGSEGWLAHVNVEAGALLVKTFDAVPRAEHAPGEAQIEIYASPAHSYVEVEVQGAYRTIAPGDALAWRVVWLARKLPPGMAPVAGSAALLAFVRGVVAADRAAVAAAPAAAAPA